MCTHAFVRQRRKSQDSARVRKTGGLSELVHVKSSACRAAGFDQGPQNSVANVTGQTDIHVCHFTQWRFDQPLPLNQRESAWYKKVRAFCFIGVVMLKQTAFFYRNGRQAGTRLIHAFKLVDKDKQLIQIGALSSCCPYKQ